MSDESWIELARRRELGRSQPLPEVFMHRIRLLTPRFLLPAVTTSVLLAILAPGAGDAATQATNLGSLTVAVGGVDRGEGSVCVALWTGDGRDFPADLERASRFLCVNAQDTVVQVKFDDLAPGRYAAMAFHDRNDDRKFGRNILGIPREASGVSNMDLSRRHRSLPRFRKAAFAVGTEPIEIRLHRH